MTMSRCMSMPFAASTKPSLTLCFPKDNFWSLSVAKNAEKTICLLITFDDGQKRLADFYGFISKSLHPSIHKYIDKTLFQQFEFDNYEIHWGTQFDIDPYDIYYGEFEAKDSPYFAEIEALKGQYELVE